jgi:hypothetical protein
MIPLPSLAQGLYDSYFGNAQDNATQSDGNYIQDLAQSRYNFSYTSFPNDLGMDDVGHYMVININVPTNNRGEGRGNFTGLSNIVDGGLQLSKVDTLRAMDGLITPGQSIPGFLTGGAFALERQTRRIVESIALYMPTPLVFNSQNIYQEVSLTALAGQGMMGIGDYLSGLRKAMSDSLGDAIQGGTRPVTDALGNAVGTASRLMGFPINPAVEILFANTPQRQFVFEVLMAPRNEAESESIKKIVKTLRFHAAPELGDIYGAFGGVYWIPPAEFDITFFNKGQENLNILRINTCVLERVEVDYSPQGVYSTFRTGHPVAVRLSLGFREIEPVHKKRILQGF